MGSSSWVHIEVKKVVKETPSAFLLELDNDESDRLWIPKSQICDHEDYSEGDENCTISITEWIAEQKGIE